MKNSKGKMKIKINLNIQTSAMTKRVPYLLSTQKQIFKVEVIPGSDSYSL